MDKFDIKSLTSEQKNTRRRILEISLKRQFSHIGSCLSAVDLIDAVYRVKKENEKFVLSNGHAGVALYAVLEKNNLIKDQSISEKLHVHPDRNKNLGIDVSTGSLGQGLPIALGLALANKNDNVYCLVSDGECAEGSIWETLRIAVDHEIKNLKIIVNANGWGAYESIDLSMLFQRIRSFGGKVIKINGHKTNDIIKSLQIESEGLPLVVCAETSVNQFPFLKGLDAHYRSINNNDYHEALRLLK